MRHSYIGASPLGRGPQIRMLLASVNQESDRSARLWALAVASQLVEEHLETIEQNLAASRHAAQRARYRRVRVVWAGCLLTICVRIDRAQTDRLER